MTQTGLLYTFALRTCIMQIALFPAKKRAHNLLEQTGFKVVGMRQPDLSFTVMCTGYHRLLYVVLIVSEGLVGAQSCKAPQCAQSIPMWYNLSQCAIIQRKKNGASKTRGGNVSGPPWSLSCTESYV